MRQVQAYVDSLNPQPADPELLRLQLLHRAAFGNLEITNARPELVVMAPEGYWRAYLANRGAGDWLPAMLELCDRVSAHSAPRLRADA